MSIHTSNVFPVSHAYTISLLFHMCISTSKKVLDLLRFIRFIWICIPPTVQLYQYNIYKYYMCIYIYWERAGNKIYLYFLALFTCLRHVKFFHIPEKKSPKSSSKHYHSLNEPQPWSLHFYARLEVVSRGDLVYMPIYNVSVDVCQSCSWPIEGKFNWTRYPEA